ncbi:MAG: type III pantothenate kinase [Luteolibacter sp.]
MAWLLIDNSNSRTKLALGDESGLLGWRSVGATTDLDSASLEKLLKGADFSGVVVASVVPEKASFLKGFFKNRCELHQLTFRSPLGYGFDLEHPEQIGNDRLANVVALKTNYGFPGIAIDFGTAVTFSVLSGQGEFCGGAIAPGMDVMTSYMHSRTAQLPSIDIGDPSSAIGKTTEDAMRVGAAFGHRGMVKGILQQLSREIPEPFQVVATGGGARFGSKGIDAIQSVDPDLTLEGLRILAGRVFTETAGD